MKIRCEYCNNYIDESEEKCPSCGSPNKDYKRVGIGVPTTIEELEQWYKEHNLPPYETTRFFIGIDYKEPKAFGIYKNDKTGKFIVYKNKDTGERKIRYEGKDEKYAVNELYMKLKEEILNQKELNAKKAKSYSQGAKSVFTTAIIVMIFFTLVTTVLPFFLNKYTPQRGYYNINVQEYYYVSGGWYVFTNDWISTNKPTYDGNINDYYQGDYYSAGGSYTDITNSSVYDESWDTSSSSSSSDWDSGSSWDSSDSWDSGGTDWGSDW